MSRLRRVLFPTDRSAASRAALLAVAGLAVGGEVEVLVLNVHDLGRHDDGLALVSEVTDSLIALAVNARSDLRMACSARVAEEIAAVAREVDPDLVVLGSRGRSDLGGLLLGSVSHEVLERASCPVLLVRAGRRPGQRRRRVLVAVAGDEDLAELAAMTASIAEPGASGLVMHLLPAAEDDLHLAAGAGLVDDLVRRLRRCGLRARGRVSVGHPGAADEIARTAVGYGADLIVMGSRRMPEVTALLQGSVSRGVVHRSDRPVLLAGRGHGAGDGAADDT